MLIDDRWGRERVQEAGEGGGINRPGISELRLRWQKKWREGFLGKEVFERREETEDAG